MPPQPPRTTARVFVEPGAWGLPTLHAESLSALALLRFTGVPLSIRRGASESMTASRTLPVVIFDPGCAAPPVVCAGLSSVTAHLTTNAALPDPNAHLTPFMIAESTAFAALLAARFAPALLHELYLDDGNYADLYHTLLSKHAADAAFPLNRLLPFLHRRRVRAQLAGRDPDALRFDAAAALAALATRLGDRNPFFYQDRPSVLDAVAYGYLAPLLHVPLQRSRLRAQVARFPNLVAFVGRVEKMFFKREGERLVDELDGEKVLAERREMVDEEARETRRDGWQQQSDKDKDKDEGDGKVEDERQRWNRYFVWGSIAAFAAHVLLGNEIEFDYE